MMKLAFGLAPTTFVLLAACSSSSSGSSVTAEQACSDYANGICNRVSACTTLFLQAEWGDSATCITRYKAICASALSAPNTGITPDRAVTCSKAITNASCDDLLNRNSPAECRSIAGTVANGAACGDDSQCVSAYCNHPANAVCGTCSPARAKSGEACATDENCDYQLTCSKARVCVAYGGMGATCDDNHPCVASLACTVPAGSMMPQGTCAKPSAEGQACTSGVGVGSCDITTVGDYCNPKSKVCEKLGLASGTGDCGYDAQTGKLTVCTQRGTCPGVDTGMITKCIPAAADGAACNVTTGPKCLAGAQCVNGICKVSDPSSCR